MLCMCVCVCVCARARMCAYVCACVRACVCVRWDTTCNCAGHFASATSSLVSITCNFLIQKLKSLFFVRLYCHRSQKKKKVIIVKSYPSLAHTVGARARTFDTAVVMAVPIVFFKSPCNSLMKRLYSHATYAGRSMVHVCVCVCVCTCVCEREGGCVRVCVCVCVECKEVSIGISYIYDVRHV